MSGPAVRGMPNTVPACHPILDEDAASVKGYRLMLGLMIPVFIALPCLSNAQ
jgi:hypothetical protein